LVRQGEIVSFFVVLSGVLGGQALDRLLPNCAVVPVKAAARTRSHYDKIM
jgi:hypothetical protein